MEIALAMQGCASQTDPQVGKGGGCQMEFEIKLVKC